MREFFLANAAYWIDEFHFDGLRVDAVHAIVDHSEDSILGAIGQRVRQAAGKRRALVVVENEHQDTNLLRPQERNGLGLDAAWNDDFHHAARVASTGRSEAYYGDYQGTPQELISAVKWGYLYQGQWNARQQRHRGSPGLELAAAQFILFLQNHDQVANSAFGRRLQQIVSPGRLRALTTLLLLAPGTPMLFQGQEFAASAAFHYFADHEFELAKMVRHGRQQAMREFHSLSGDDAIQYMLDPGNPQTFLASKLDPRERTEHAAIYQLHVDLLRLRREDPVFASQRADRLHGAVLAAEAFALRYFGEQGDDRLLVVNLGRDWQCGPASEPLLAPPSGRRWQVLFGSENPRYNGGGMGVWDESQPRLSGHAAVVLRAEDH